MPSATAPLWQGTLDLIVLQLLDAAPTNGYDLTLRIQATTRPGRKHLAEQREAWQRFSGALAAILRVT
jgi:hypothetical protein